MAKSNKLMKAFFAGNDDVSKPSSIFFYISKEMKEQYWDQKI